MRVAELMTQDVQTVPQTMPASDAWGLMRTKGIHHLLVIADGALVGVLSDRDAGGRNGASVRVGATVGDLMTPSPVTVDSNATIRQAANLMRGRSIGAIPVVERDRLVGIVTVSDLLELLGRGVERPVKPPRRGLHHRAPHRKQKGAFGVW